MSSLLNVNITYGQVNIINIIVGIICSVWSSIFGDSFGDKYSVCGLLIQNKEVHVHVAFNSAKKCSAAVRDSVLPFDD